MVPADTKLETETREAIEQKLIAAGWAIQDKDRLNLQEKLGVAIREMDTNIIKRSDLPSVFRGVTII